MTGQWLRVAWYRLRATFRRRWGGYLALALLIGLIGGVAMAAMTAARRTDASYPTFLASTNLSDLLVVPQANSYAPGLVKGLAALPHVRSVEAGDQFNAVTLTPRGNIGTPLITQVELIASPNGLFSDQDRLTIVQGRRPNPKRPDEVIATTEAAAVLGLHLGSRIPVGIDEDNAKSLSPFYRKLDLTVVGLGVLNIQIVHDDIDTNRTGFLVGTPALLRAYGSCCSASSYAGLQLTGGSRSDATAEQDYARLLETSPATAESGGQLVIYVTSAIEAQAQRAIRPEAVALAVFAVIAVLAAVIIGIQSISRQLRAGVGETDVLRALGAGPAATTADGLLGVVGAVAVGSLLAMAVAASLSPLTLFGPVTQVEPAGGVYLDWTVLGLGGLGLVLIVGGAATVLAYRQAPRQRAGRLARERGSGLVRAALAVGLPTSGVAGLRFAMEPGRGRTAVPVRSVLAGAVLAVGVGAATLTFGASLNALISHPALYGWNFSDALYSVDGYGPLPVRWADPLLASDRLVAASTGVYFATVEIDGQTIPAIASPVRAAVAPRLLSGHSLDGNRQIVLGPASLAQLHKRVGGIVTVSEGHMVPLVRLRIVGTAALPTIGDVLGVHASMSTGAIFSTQLVSAAALDYYGPIAGPNAIFVRLRPGVSPSAGVHSLDRISRQLNRDASSPQSAAVAGDVVKYIQATSVLPAQRPAEIVNYKSMGRMPATLASGLAAGAVAALGLTLVASVRRRRRDFALLKTLGFTRRQLAAAVAWQSSAITAAGLLIGVPLGIAAGRWLWLLFARELSAVPDPTIPVGSLVLAGLAALLLANVVAAIPGRSAARTPAADVLRAE
jgi:hypothetical protein